MFVGVRHAVHLPVLLGQSPLGVLYVLLALWKPGSTGIDGLWYLAPRLMERPVDVVSCLTPPSFFFGEGSFLPGGSSLIYHVSRVTGLMCRVVVSEGISIFEYPTYGGWLVTWGGCSMYVFLGRTSSRR